MKRNPKVSEALEMLRRKSEEGNVIITDSSGLNVITQDSGMSDTPGYERAFSYKADFLREVRTGVSEGLINIYLPGYVTSEFLKGYRVIDFGLIHQAKIRCVEEEHSLFNALDEAGRTFDPVDVYDNFYLNQLKKCDSGLMGFIVNVLRMQDFGNIRGEISFNDVTFVASLLYLCAMGSANVLGLNCDSHIGLLQKRFLECWQEYTHYGYYGDAIWRISSRLERLAGFKELRLPSIDLSDGLYRRIKGKGVGKAERVNVVKV